MGKAEKVLRVLEDLGKKDFLPAIGPAKGRILSRLIKKYHVERVLEIGALYGYSAILMGKDVDEVISIEIDARHVSVASANIEKAGLSGKVKIIEGDALEEIQNVRGKIDLLFIDGQKKDYLSYLKLAESLLHSGSLIVADNVGIFKESMLDYLNYVRYSGKYSSTTEEVALAEPRSGMDAMEISVAR